MVIVKYEMRRLTEYHKYQFCVPYTTLRVAKPRLAS